MAGAVQKVSVRAADGITFELDREQVYRSDFLQQQLKDAARQEEHAPCLHIGLQHSTREQIQRCFGYLKTPPPIEAHDDTIFDDLNVANYLALQPAIQALCEWVAGAIEGCASSDAITKRFQMGKRAELEEEEQGAQQKSEAETHPPGRFESLHTTFWTAHLQPILSNTALENLSHTCPEFGPLARYNSISKVLTFKEVTAPKRLRELEDLSDWMNLAEEKMTDIAVKLVERLTESEGDENEGSQVHLHDIFGEVLHLEMEFDYFRALDDQSEYRFNVIQLIIDAYQSGPQAEFKHSEKVAWTQEKIKALLQQVRGYLERNKDETVARLAAARSFIIKTMVEPNSGAPDDEIDSIVARYRSKSPPRTRGVCAKRRRGGPAGATDMGREQLLARLRRVRTFPPGCPWSMGIWVEPGDDGDGRGREREAIGCLSDVIRHASSSPHLRGHATLECQYRLPPHVSSAAIALWNVGPSPALFKVSSSRCEVGELITVCPADVRRIVGLAAPCWGEEDGEGCGKADETLEFVDQAGHHWLRIRLVR